MPPPVTKMRGYGIGAAARQTGVNIETIRYYERIGLMPKPARTPGGNRQYDEDQIRRLAFVKRCRELGFSIREIRSLLDMTDSNDFTCRQVHALTTEHLSKVERKLADLARLQTVLQQMADECSKGDIPDCPVITTLLEADGPDFSAKS